MNIEVANKLVKLRKEHGYSQEELAHRLGISRQAVSKWERAESSPDTDNLICLAKLYNVSLDELLNTEDDIETIIEEQIKEEKDYDIEKVIDKMTKEALEENPKLERINGVLILLIIIAYFIVSSIWNLWHPFWIVFLLIPVATTLTNAIYKKNANVFAFPVLITAIYLVMGFLWKLWHPGWVVFLLIPIYYIIFQNKDDEE